jgi:hypothetical protein
MKKTMVLGCAAAAAVLALGACIFPIFWPDTEPSDGRFGAFTRTVALEPGGTIQLENVLGDIEIRGWDKSEVEITAEEDWNIPFRGRIWVPGRRIGTADIEVETADRNVKIRARLPEREREIRSLHFSLMVPRSVNLDMIRAQEGDVTISDIYGKVRVEVERGRVQVENFSGSLDLAVGRGSVEAEVLDVRPDDVLKIVARDGDISLLLPDDAAVRVEAAAGGAVTSEFDLGRELPARKVEGRVGTAEGAALTLSAPQGNVRLLKAKGQA